jgi:transposase-like protein
VSDLEPLAHGELVESTESPTERQEAYWYRRFTPEARQACLDAARKGLSLPGVAGKARISPSTLWRWIDRGLDDPDSPYHEFALDFAAVVAEWEESQLDKGERLAQDNKATWTWYMTHLERRMQRAYGKLQKLDVRHSATGEFEKRIFELNQDSTRATGD